MDYPARRRQNLARGLRKDGLDAFLVTNPLNVSYLTGFTGDSSFLLLTPRRAILVSDDRFRVQIEEECPGLEAYIRPHDRNTWQATAEVIDKLGARNVGVESQHLTLAGLETLKDLAPAVDWAPRRDRVEQLRAIKDPSEVEAIRRAIRAAERAFAMLRATISERDTEKELADALEGYVRRAGGETGAFPAIVAVGDRSALPHAPPTARAAGEAGFLLVDWGARRGMYHSDLTRVMRAPAGDGAAGRRERGKVESKLRGLYTTVLSAQRAAAEAVRDGADVKKVDAAARRVIERAGYGDRFTHGLGHGIGLQIHEAPSVRTNSDDVLRAGMVLTLEPGVYLPGFGGVRVEDDFLVTPDGCERLTSLPQEWEHYFG